MTSITFSKEAINPDSINYTYSNNSSRSFFKVNPLTNQIIVTKDELNLKEQWELNQRLAQLAEQIIHRSGKDLDPLLTQLYEIGHKKTYAFSHNLAMAAIHCAPQERSKLQQLFISIINFVKKIFYKLLGKAIEKELEFVHFDDTVFYELPNMLRLTKSDLAKATFSIQTSGIIPKSYRSKLPENESYSEEKLNECVKKMELNLMPCCLNLKIGMHAYTLSYKEEKKEFFLELHHSDNPAVNFLPTASLKPLKEWNIKPLNGWEVEASTVKGTAATTKFKLWKEKPHLKRIDENTKEFVSGESNFISLNPGWKYTLPCGNNEIPFTFQISKKIR